MSRQKVKKCKACRNYFVPVRPLQRACSPMCAIDIAQSARERKDRREIRAAKERLKTRAQWLKEAQAAFNAWVRWRDRDRPCISCGAMGRQHWDAGHFRSIGAAPALRFDPDNVHKQCIPCNQHKSGNAIEYRMGLIRRIGLWRVEWLEGEHPPKKYSVDEIRGIRDDYRRILRDAKRKAAGEKG